MKLRSVLVLVSIVVALAWGNSYAQPKGWFLMVPPAVPEQFPPLPPSGKTMVLTTAPVKSWWKTPPNNPYLFFTLEACETGRKKLQALPPPANETEDFKKTISTQSAFAQCVASDDPALQ